MICGAMGFLFALVMRNGQRVTALEVSLKTLINLIGKRAAILLHSPHTPEVDKWLEFISRGERIPDSEIQGFIDKLVQLEADESETELRRNLATQVLLMVETIYKTPYKLGDVNKRHGIPAK